MEANELKLIEKFSKKLPKFPDGRIDYSNSSVAIVLNCFVKFKNKFLILKRSGKVGAYKYKWNCIAGYIDEIKPIEEKIFEELNEEIGITKNEISSIKFGKKQFYHDKSISKKWIIFPALVELKNDPKIMLNWEHIDYKWILFEEISEYEIIPGLDSNLKRLLSKIKEQKDLYANLPLNNNIKR